MPAKPSIPAVFRVIGHDPDGAPRDFRLIRDNEQIRIGDDDAFWVMDVPPALLRRKN